jgi:hypothetical protein
MAMKVEKFVDGSMGIILLMDRSVPVPERFRTHVVVVTHRAPWIHR